MSPIEITARISHIKIEMRAIGKNMSSISPKLELYKKYQRELDKLNDELNRLRSLRK